MRAGLCRYPRLIEEDPAEQCSALQSKQKRKSESGKRKQINAERGVACTSVPENIKYYILTFSQVGVLFLSCESCVSRPTMPRTLELMTRTGKIARLPLGIRTELNRRLLDGEQGIKLVEWLNASIVVKEVLEEEFGGRPISGANLSQWKSGGYQDWLRHEESRQIVSSLAEQHQELDEAADGKEISDRFAGMLSVELIPLTRTLLEEKKSPAEKWQQLREVLRELSQLRRDDHRATRLTIKRDRWQRRVEREDEKEDKRMDKEHREKLCAPYLAMLELDSMAKLFGGGEAARRIAAFILECQNDLEPGRLVNNLDRKSDPPPSAPNSTELK